MLFSRIRSLFPIIKLAITIRTLIEEVKCQNLRYLNLSLYFNLLCHFQVHHALYHLPVVIASPLYSHHSVCMLFHTHHIPSKVVNKIAPFVQFPSPFSLFPLHLFSTTPLSYQHTLLFPSTFFTLCLLTTQIKMLPPSHKL